MIIETSEETYLNLQNYMQEQMKKTNYFTIGFHEKSLIGQLLDDTNSRNKELRISINNDINQGELIFTKDNKEIFRSYLSDFKNSLIIK